MPRLFFRLSLAVSWIGAVGAVAVIPGAAAAGGIAVQQSSAVNNVHVIQERNPFHTREVDVTARSGHATATEIIEIGPDPIPLSISQVGTINRATIYQRGSSPNLDVQQSGAINSVRSHQYAMP